MGDLVKCITLCTFSKHICVSCRAVEIFSLMFIAMEVESAR